MSEIHETHFDVLQRITELRQARGMSAYRLSKLSSIPQSTIATWYQKKIYPPVDKIEKLCDAMNITLAEFFRTEEDYYAGRTEDALFLEKWHALPLRERKAVTDLLDLLSSRNIY